MRTEYSIQKSGVRRRSLVAQCTGFSLVEVTLAMAVMAVGLIAILGLIPQGVTSSRNAADNTTAATMVQDLFSTIRASPFTAVDLNGFGKPPLSPPPYKLAPPAVASSGTTYFDQAGLNPTTDADSYFKVVLSFQPHNLPSPLALAVVTATVSWPAKPGMATFLNTTTFMTQVAQYN